MRRDRTLPARPIHTLASTIALLAALLLPPAVGAQASDGSRWRVRADVHVLYPDTDPARVALGAGSTTLDVEEGGGFGLALEYRPTRRFGIELGYVIGEIDATFTLDTALTRFTDTATFDTEIATLGVNYHFRPDRRIGVEAGVFVAMSTFDGAIFLTEEGLRFKRVFDDDVGFGAQVGVSAPFGASGRWSVEARLRYLATLLEAETAGEGDLDLDLVMPSLSIAYRF